MHSSEAGATQPPHMQHLTTSKLEFASTIVVFMLAKVKYEDVLQAEWGYVVQWTMREGTGGPRVVRSGQQL